MTLREIKNQISSCMKSIKNNGYLAASLDNFSRQVSEYWTPLDIWNATNMRFEWGHDFSGKEDDTTIIFDIQNFDYAFTNEISKLYQSALILFGMCMGANPEYKTSIFKWDKSINTMIDILERDRQQKAAISEILEGIQSIKAKIKSKQPGRQTMSTDHVPQKAVMWEVVNAKQPLPSAANYVQKAELNLNKQGKKNPYKSLLSTTNQFLKRESLPTLPIGKTSIDEFKGIKTKYEKWLKKNP